MAFSPSWIRHNLQWYAIGGLGLIAFWAGACQSAPPPKTAASPPPVERSAPQVLPASHQVPEPVPAPPEPSSAMPDGVPGVAVLTLDEAVRQAMGNNPRLRQLAAGVVAAQASADVAFAPFLPEIGSAFRYSGFSIPVLPGGSFVPASLPTGVNSFMIAEAGVQYTLADFGRRAGQYNQAINRARIEEQTAIRARQTVAFETAQAYFRLLAALTALRVREEALRDAERILADTKARLLGGVVQREAVLRAEVEFSQARQYLLVVLQTVRDAEATLNVVMGRPANMPLRAVEIAVQPAFNDSLDACLATAASDRREILIAREAAAEARGGVQEARGELLPKIFVRGTVLRADSPGPLNGFIEGIGIHAEQPLYAGGRYRGNLRRSEAQVAAAYAGLQVIADNISLQVNLAFQAIETDRQRIQLGQVTVAQARENLRLTRVRYDNATATPTDIVDAQTALVQAETSYFTAIYGYLEGLSRLDYAIGGDQSRLLVRLQNGRPPGQ